MSKWLAAVAVLLIVGGCDAPRTSVSGSLIASCATPAATTTTTAATGGRPVHGYAGPCFDGTDRTDRTDRMDRTDRTDRKNRDDVTDRTDRKNRDDTTDRTVWCVEPAMIITAPSFIVFFDFDKADLTSAAQDTIAKAAMAYRTKGGAQIKASGHTDRAGTEAYNMALSLRRANAVRDQLIREGVAASDISVVALGESHPMIQTADGVREAQNRRVEIVVQ
ncbi:MAG: OmpA family protein [Enhydrobacter sp.]|nr:OmpA family protein [Enhydrobacter sp.]